MSTKYKKNIPFHNFGGQGEMLHFAHANGFNPGAYRQLLLPLKEYFHVIAIQHRPFWQQEPTNADDWQQIADDLINFLDQQGAKNIVGVGHSLGAVATMLAAIKRPDLFKNIILIEPVFMPAVIVKIFQIIPVKWRYLFNPLIKLTLNRRDVWDSKQEVFEAYRQKKVFADLSDEVLWDYLNFGLKERADGKVTLAFSKEWEAHFFSRLPPIWENLRRLQTPTFGLRGEYSNTLFLPQWKKWQNLRPEHQFLEVKNTGHLLPLEKPALVAEKILTYLQV